MAKTESITPEQRAAAASAAKAEKDAKAEKAAKERERRTVVKALEKAELDMKPGDLDVEQRERAAKAPEQKAGLSGKALAGWILEGKNAREQAAASREKKAAENGGSARANVTRSKDPEATQLAKAAVALGGPDSGSPAPVKSSILPKEARDFLTLKGDRPATALLSRTIPAEGEEPQREVTVTQSALRRFAVDGEKGTDEAKVVRAHLTALGSGTRLWGRKLGLFILAQIAAEKK